MVSPFHRYKHLTEIVGMVHTSLDGMNWYCLNVFRLFPLSSSYSTVIGASILERQSIHPFGWPAGTRLRAAWSLTLLRSVLRCLGGFILVGWFVERDHIVSVSTTLSIPFQFSGRAVTLLSTKSTMVRLSPTKNPNRSSSSMTILVIETTEPEKAESHNGNDHDRKHEMADMEAQLFLAATPSSSTCSTKTRSLIIAMDVVMIVTALFILTMEAVVLHAYETNLWSNDDGSKDDSISRRWNGGTNRHRHMAVMTLLSIVSSLGSMYGVWIHNGWFIVWNVTIRILRAIVLWNNGMTGFIKSTFWIYPHVIYLFRIQKWPKCR